MNPSPLHLEPKAVDQPRGRVPERRSTPQAAGSYREGMERNRPESTSALQHVQLRMEHPRECLIEAARERAGNERVEIAALGPISLVAEPGHHLIVEARTRQRIADGDADIVGNEVAYESAGRLDLLPSLARVSELKEQPYADAMLV